jgi:hypothetical protein
MLGVVRLPVTFLSLEYDTSASGAALEYWLELTSTAS